MKKIIKNTLDLNDEVSNKIQLLFETFFYVSIENIKRVSINKKGKYHKYEFDYKDNEDYYQFLK